jgi:Phage major coat protein, Gp8
MKKLALAMLAMVVSGASQAAIVTADLTAIGTEVSADAATVFSWALPIMGTLLAMTIGIKLIKRFTRAF